MSSSKGIDYSKWDKMVADMTSSEDDEDDDMANTNQNGSYKEQQTQNSANFVYDNELSTKHANVTRLKKPSSVTIGPKGITINDDNKKKPIPSSHQKNKKKYPNLTELLNKWAHNGGIHNFDYLWLQTADELIIRFLVPRNTKTKNIKIGFKAETKEFSLNINLNDNEEVKYNKLFSRKLKESVEEDAKLEWELCNIDMFDVNNNKLLLATLTDILCTNIKIDTLKEYIEKLKNSRFLLITLEKEKINNRIIEWWDCLFENDSKINLEKRIKDRRTDSKKMNNIWEKAHTEFKKKIANHKPQEIYVPEECDDQQDNKLDID